MSHYNIEPLEPTIWLLQLKKLAESIPAEEAELMRALRRAFYLVQLAPRPLRHVIACAEPEQQFEKLLQAGDLLAAAEALAGDPLQYILALGAKGGAEAEVRFPGAPASCRAVAPTAALALFAAWLQCLLTLDEPHEFGEDWARFPSPRKSLSGRRPKLTEH